MNAILLDKSKQRYCSSIVAEQTLSEFNIPSQLGQCLISSDRGETPNITGINVHDIRLQVVHHI